MPVKSAASQKTEGRELFIRVTSTVTMIACATQGLLILFTASELSTVRVIRFKSWPAPFRCRAEQPSDRFPDSASRNFSGETGTGGTFRRKPGPRQQIGYTVKPVPPIRAAESR
jgi:hypothetical protein